MCWQELGVWRGAKRPSGSMPSSGDFPGGEASLRQQARSLPHCSSKWDLEGPCTSPPLTGSRRVRIKDPECPPGPLPHPEGNPNICLTSSGPFGLIFSVQRKLQCKPRICSRGPVGSLESVIGALKGYGRGKKKAHRRVDDLLYLKFPPL